MASVIKRCAGALLLAGVLVVGAGVSGGVSGGLSAGSALAADPPPFNTQLEGKSKGEMWSGVRQGVQGLVSIPDKRAGTLIQSEGEAWRAVRNGPLSEYGSWVLGGIFALLALFFLVRGRIRIDGRKTGRTIQRFNAFERAVHWLTAGSFVVLGVTGLNVLYGRHTILPLLGPETFAAMTHYGKLAHNFLGFAFIVGVTLTFVLWVRHNIPERHDLVWFLKAGGLFSKGVHPPARKFNGGQKIIFWSTVVGGGILGFTGVQLIFPFSFATLGELQLYQLVHSAVAIVMIAIIVAHIYIGSVGMEGAFDAMGSGQVELQWAREHHSLWVEEVTGERVDHHHHHRAPAE
ncbi:formate dehydrogenase subunit gamma [Azospirillum thermophilum]|uniref:Formate dehydrogenase subunit gamma n=1 Tax=Azospirillum thermophilum TaxID=2202148 RepID=A0A2S2CR38_9PROT|nr:formate dehydrogenase subunit gamma [Azospirillum thermophilum]AWK86757.1 formate dehydrogenase subunit gamma [Azospirillum thermophilum]